MRARNLRHSVAVVSLGLLAGQTMSATAQSTMSPAEPGALIQELCLDTVSVGDKAILALKRRERPEDTIREEKFAKASVHHLTLSEATRVELTIAHDDNAVMSCAVHAQIGDLKATFAELQKRFTIKGKLADYLLGQPAKDTAFVSKAGKKMLGLFEFQQAEGQVAGSVQAIILRDEAASGPAAVKASSIKTGTTKTAAAKTPIPKAGAKTAATKPAP